jgi:hypothetical protein
VTGVTAPLGTCRAELPTGEEVATHITKGKAPTQPDPDPEELGTSRVSRGHGLLPAGPPPLLREILPFYSIVPRLLQSEDTEPSTLGLLRSEAGFKYGDLGNKNGAVGRGCLLISTLLIGQLFLPQNPIPDWLMFPAPPL